MRAVVTPPEQKVGCLLPSTIKMIIPYLLSAKIHLGFPSSGFSSLTQSTAGVDVDVIWSISHHLGESGPGEVV